MRLLFCLLILVSLGGCAYRSEFTITADAEAVAASQPQARLAVVYRAYH